MFRVCKVGVRGKHFSDNLLREHVRDGEFGGCSMPGKGNLGGCSMPGGVTWPGWVIYHSYSLMLCL